MKLTANFSLHEMVKSESAARLGIDNTPTDEVIKNLKILCENVLQPVRDHFKLPVKVASGYRSPKINEKVGGAKMSDHMTGMAADIEVPSIANYDLALWIKNNLKFKQLILEFYTPGILDSGWVHVSYDPANLKNQVLTAVNQNGKTVYLNDLVL